VKTKYLTVMMMMKLMTMVVVVVIRQTVRAVSGRRDHTDISMKIDPKGRTPEKAMMGKRLVNLTETDRRRRG
jgi:hypothetical protein